MKVRVSARARREANLLNAWWKENRPYAPTLFTDELGDALEPAAAIEHLEAMLPVSSLLREVSG